MKYKEIKVYTTHEKLDDLIELFAIYEEIGIEISEEDRPHVTFYVPEGESVPEALAEGLKSPEYEMISAVVDDQDWLHKWEEYYVPTKISSRFVVKPVWRDYVPKEGEELIEIDPGMAFGTGTHPTSYLCVQALEGLDLQGKSVLDVGCGTGILSLAAAKLGAGDIMAVDLDPEAVRSTRRNAELNHCIAQMTIREGDLTKGLDYKADVVVANLLHDLVILLTESVAKHCRSGAVFISSGILDEKEALVCDHIRKAGFEILEVTHDSGWCAVKAVWKDQ